jgi:hypothetical protein
MADTKFILINATGRSGSTTLQQIINTLPKSNICGEHTTEFLNILYFYKRIKYVNEENIKHNYTNYEYLINKKIKVCHYNSLNYEKNVNNIRNLIIDMFDNGDKSLKFIGCKNMTMTNELLILFKELFPLAKIILHIRTDVEEQINNTQISYCQYSSNNNSKNENMKHLNGLNETYRLFHEENKDFTYLSKFEDLFDFEKIKKMFEFLDSDADEEEINTILNSYVYYNNAKKN